MPSLIEELQRDSIDSKIPVTQLLQKCLIVATKLDVKELAAWARLELDGYPDTNVPNYRRVSGAPQVFNPYNGYQPIAFGRAEHQQTFSRMSFNQPISQLEHEMMQADKQNNGAMNYTYSPEAEIALRNALRPSLGLQPSLSINTSQLRKIVEAVTRNVLEWSLRLEAAGVKGDGMSFSREEKEKAQSVTYNIETYIHGNVHHSQVRTVASTQHNTAQDLDLMKLREIVAALKSNSDDFPLEHPSAEELKAEIQTLEAQANSPKPKSSIVKASLASIRTILESAAGNLAGSLAAAAIIREIGKYLG